MNSLQEGILGLFALPKALQLYRLFGYKLYGIIFKAIHIDNQLKVLDQSASISVALEGE